MANGINAFFFKRPLDTTYLPWQLNEIFKDKLYEPYLRGKKDLTIIDLGFFYGNFSYYASPFAKQIYAFEPNKESFEVGKLQLEFNEIKNVKLYNTAISNKDGKAPFFAIDMNKTMSSLVPVDPNMKPDYEIETIRLDTFFEREEIKHVDLLKLDVEGSETLIVSSDSFLNVAAKIDIVVCERHAWSGYHPNQLIDAFKNAGFTSVKQIPNQADILVASK